MVIIEGYFKAEVPEIPMENCRPGIGFIITLSHSPLASLYCQLVRKNFALILLEIP